MADDRKKKPKTKPIGGSDRAFRRLEAQDGPDAPLPVAWAFGAGLGAFAGMAALAWDVAVLERARIPVLPVLDAPAVMPWIVGYAALGAALGLSAGALGLFGVRWATAAACGVVGWCLAGWAARVAADAGVPGVVGLGGVMAIAWVGGQLLGRLPAPPAVHAAFASGTFASALVLVPLHEHLLASSTSLGAFAASAGVVAMTAPFAAICVLTARQGRPPVTSIAALTSLGAGAALALRAAPPPPPPTPGVGPVVVLVALDGVRHSDVPALPSLGALARRATAFDQAWSTSNWAVPAVGSALTGRWPYGHQAGLNGGSGPLGSALDPRVPTLADSLRRVQFATVGVTSDPALRVHGLDRGFARWEDRPLGGAAPAAAGPLRASGLLPPALRGEVPPALVTDRALAALAQPGAQLLLVHHSALRDGGGDAAALDAELARLFEAVPRDAWLVVFGTHGRAGTERRASVEDAGSVGMFDERVHVPLLVAGPQVAARRVDRVVSLVDLPATLAQVVSTGGLGDPKVVVAGDGLPLAEVFGAAGEAARVVFAQSSARGPERQLALSWPYALHRAGENTALYDLLRDPTQREPLRVDPSLDPVERRLEAALLTDGSPEVRGERPGVAEQLGQLAARAWGEGR